MSVYNRGKSIGELKDYVLKHFSYNAETGIIIRNDRKNGFGSLDKDGYLILKIKGRQFKAHRIAWFLYYGEMPMMELDHINHIRTDNRICNLRVVDRKKNVHNIRQYPNKDTGVVGVYEDKATSGLKKRFVTRIKNKTYRFYSVEDAVKFREKYGNEF